MTYDSSLDTLKHIAEVQKWLRKVFIDLACRYSSHDASKLESPEKEVFDEFTPKLAGSTYGSEEYKGFLKEMKVGLDHHYAKNSHHPEHHTGSYCFQCGLREDTPCTCGGPRVSVAGIRGMSLMDLTEMICDWRAATERHADGDIYKSIEINQKRFGYDDDLKQIFLNTIRELGA